MQDTIPPMERRQYIAILLVIALNLVKFTSETFPTLISNSFVVLVGQVDFYYLRFFFKPCSSFLYKNPSSRLEL
ncbi:uncharacterized protein Gasu_29730 [Galdieria sulphuraria]|uniref:Uncharacterized protein n=1 Tax=Galdieria sulphuraria TaxID=130081 RepID=M2XI38_GALSU|nr:uncharacterized protein Gasu_29730 [Galdieria sulphuraria]EME29757.1 hypothetical protein Gasu_29730 [Galdieria sulphuraria]|eukprot:XP_005706277.1 hypothetical protein Gasu_29730 [Galdieria sulphuraria]